MAKLFVCAQTGMCLWIQRYVSIDYKRTRPQMRHWAYSQCLCDVSLHMFCYDVAKMTSRMRSGIANVYVSFSTKNANLRVIVSPEKLHCNWFLYWRACHTTFYALENGVSICCASPAPSIGADQGGRFCRQGNTTPGSGLNAMLVRFNIKWA